MFVVQSSGFSQRECDWYHNIDSHKLPLVYTPRRILRYSNVLCVCQGQTDVINRYYRKQGIEATLGAYRSIARKAGTPVSQEKLKEITKNIYSLIDREKVMCDEYYVCYNATARPFSFLYRILSMIRQIQRGTAINRDATIFRMSNPQNVDNVQEFLTVMQQKIHEQKTPDHANRYLAGTTDANGSMYDRQGTPALDWQPWFKDVAMSVNLSLLGSERSGESTLFYFLTGKANTSVTVAMSLIQKVVKELPLDAQQQHFFYQRLVAHFDHFYQRVGSTRYHVDSSLFQIFIKKKIIDKILYISTPFGNPLPIRASEFCEDLQKNNVDMLLGKMNDIYNSPDSNFVVLPKTTRERMAVDGLTESLLSVQGRLISTADDILLEEGAVRVFDFSDTFQDELEKELDLYRIIVDMLITCKLDADCSGAIAQEYTVAAKDLCSMM